MPHQPQSRRSRRAPPPSDPHTQPRPDNNELLIDWVNASPDGEVFSELSSEIGIVSTLYDACLRLLTSISREYLTGQNATSQQKARLTDSQAALCLFGDGLVDHGGLETCLKYDEELRDDLITLFCSLGRLLLRCTAGSPSSDIPSSKSRNDLVSELKGLLDKASVIIGQPGVEEDGDDDPSSSRDDDREANQNDARDAGELIEEDALDSLNDYVTSLLDLRPLLDDVFHDAFLRHPKPDTRDENVNFRVSDAAGPYILQVHDKFRNASPFLVERLGEANWQRYLRVKSKMEAGSVVEDIPELPIPKSLFRPSSDFHDSGIGSSQAASVASHTSFQSTDTDVSKGRARVPKTPSEVSRGLAFTCFICGKRLSAIRNRIDWKMHVFADLSSYICTFQDCPKMLDTYPTRKLWAEHELTSHRSDNFFECHDCSNTFSVASDFNQHLVKEHHYDSLNHTQMLAVLSAAKKSTPHPVDTYKCPFCHRDAWPSQRSFITHVGNHLEEISLSALPRDVDSCSEAEEDQSLSSSSAFKDVVAGQATDILEPSNRPQEKSLLLKNAMAYLDQVKTANSEQPEIYDRFIDVIASYQSKRIGVPEVRASISDLFSSSPELIEGFKRFYPAAYGVNDSKMDRSGAKENITTYLAQPPPAAGPGHHNHQQYDPILDLKVQRLRDDLEREERKQRRAVLRLAASKEEADRLKLDCDLYDEKLQRSMEKQERDLAELETRLNQEERERLVETWRPRERQRVVIHNPPAVVIHNPPAVVSVREPNRSALDRVRDDYEHLRRHLPKEEAMETGLWVRRSTRLKELSKK